MVKRKKTSKAFPSAHVFPGGVIDISDSNFKEWGKVFRKEQLKYEDFSKRLCSIRELFEETNILLSDKDKDIPFPSSKSTDGSWFIDYCSKHNITPSIDKLIPFSQWITPLHKLNTSKRFDTFFYIIEVEGDLLNNSFPNLDEVSSVEWFTTNEVIERNKEGTIKLAPPTYVKILQMNQFNYLDDLINYSKTKTITPILPILKENEDGSLTAILPGDLEHPDSKQDHEKVLRVRVNKNGILEIDDKLLDLLIHSKL